MVTRQEIEAKARQIQEAVEETRSAMADTAVLAGLAVVAAVGIAYLIGRRKGSRSRTVVEVYEVK
ncbi:MAG: hypothetical protein KatS3mg011_1967 [Acidimicrobiia bacterium]|nr:MAG: hypothetical protein KatS3mg011_1967 [Acidimicrobiia bacterium]